MSHQPVPVTSRPARRNANEQTLQAADFRLARKLYINAKGTTAEGAMHMPECEGQVSCEQECDDGMRV